METQITVIPPKEIPKFNLDEGIGHKKRVAAYARVSTDYEEQLNSYAAQIKYYSGYIKSNPEWEFVEVYTDEGISATSTTKRDGFNRMIADALNGRIDLILTKSVSRFARNTVDTLTNVRKLKEKGVEVFFEKEQIYTMDSKGELLITIMSSLAQEESRSISENVTWGHRKRFAEGKIMLPYKAFLGYRKGADGLPEIVPEEAKTIEYIYKRFLEGSTPKYIAHDLMRRNIQTARGNKRWYASNVESILKNEKYKGDALLQKSYTIDFLTKKTRKNHGEVQQYYVHNSHPAIISPPVFDAVQKEFVRRKAIGFSFKRSFLGGKLICGDCGTLYGAKVWHSNSEKYKNVAWRCNDKYANGATCQTPSLKESVVKPLFIKAFNKVIAHKNEIIKEHRIVANALTDCSSLEKKVETLRFELEGVEALAKQLIDQNSKMVMDQNSYKLRYAALNKKHEDLEKDITAQKELISERTYKAMRLNGFLDELEKQDSLITEFDENLWNASIEVITVYKEGRLVFRFMNGIEQEEWL